MIHLVPGVCRLWNVRVKNHLHLLQVWVNRVSVYIKKKKKTLFPTPFKREILNQTWVTFFKQWVKWNMADHKASCTSKNIECNFSFKKGTSIIFITEAYTCKLNIYVWEMGKLFFFFFLPFVKYLFDNKKSCSFAIIKYLF